jgi:thiamine pyrophosphate-dependent acetolactate synthase large subunit-like protein
VIAVEGSHAASEVVLNLKVSAPERFIMPLHASAIGQGLGCAIGAAVAEPSEWTFLFTGDGSLLMSAQELDTLRQLQLPLVIIVLDDGAYGSEVQYSHLLGLPDALAYTNNPDFVAVANGFGIEARRIEHLDDLDGIRDIVAGPRVPHLVSVPIDPEHLNEWFSSFAGDHHHRLPHWGDGA